MWRGLLWSRCRGNRCEVVTEEYLWEARAPCTANGTVMILDEVQCGLGRTGKWFAFQHFDKGGDAVPDIFVRGEGRSAGGLCRWGRW